MRRLYSYSRRNILDRCLRQYFFDYYASAKQCQISEESKAYIRRLKVFSNCALLAGDILHRFAKLHVAREDISPEWLERTALAAYDEAIEFARDPKAHTSLLQNRFPPKELVEFSYADLDGEKAADTARRSLETALHNLFYGDTVHVLFASLEGYELYPEKRLSGLKCKNWSISGQIDLLAVGKHQCNVIDWKLGGKERGADSLQLYIYGWFASAFAKLDRQAVHVQRVFLRDNFVEDPQTIDDGNHVGHARLLQDIELMEELHGYGCQGREEVFRKCNHEGICQRCKYRTLCHKIPLGERSLVTSVSSPVTV